MDSEATAQVGDATTLSSPGYEPPRRPLQEKNPNQISKQPNVPQHTQLKNDASLPKAQLPAVTVGEELGSRTHDGPEHAPAPEQTSEAIKTLKQKHAEQARLVSGIKNTAKATAFEVMNLIRDLQDLKAQYGEKLAMLEKEDFDSLKDNAKDVYIGLSALNSRIDKLEYAKGLGADSGINGDGFKNLREALRALQSFEHKAVQKMLDEQASRIEALEDRDVQYTTQVEALENRIDKLEHANGSGAGLGVYGDGLKNLPEAPGALQSVEYKAGTEDDRRASISHESS